MERICKTAHEYAGRQRQVGERFDVEPEHVEVLTKIGHIEADDHAAAGASPEPYATRAMTAQRDKRGNQRKAA
jgi:hypothetical protein